MIYLRKLIPVSVLINLLSISSSFSMDNDGNLTPNSHQRLQKEKKLKKPEEAFHPIPSALTYKQDDHVNFEGWRPNKNNLSSSASLHSIRPLMSNDQYGHYHQLLSYDLKKLDFFNEKHSSKSVPFQIQNAWSYKPPKSPKPFLPLHHNVSIVGSGWGGAGDDDKEPSFKFDADPESVAIQVLFNIFNTEWGESLDKEQRLILRDLPGNLPVEPFLVILSHSPTDDYVRISQVSKTLYDLTHDKYVALVHLKSMAHNPALVGVRIQEIEGQFKNLGNSMWFFSKKGKLAREAFERDFAKDINALWKVVKVHQQILEKKRSFSELSFFDIISKGLQRDQGPLGILAHICTLSHESFNNIHPIFFDYIRQLSPKIAQDEIINYRDGSWRNQEPYEPIHFNHPPINFDLQQEWVLPTLNLTQCLRELKEETLYEPHYISLDLQLLSTVRPLILSEPLNISQYLIEFNKEELNEKDSNEDSSDE